MTFHLCPYSKVSHSPNKLPLSAATHTHTHIEYILLPLCLIILQKLCLASSCVSDWL